MKINPMRFVLAGTSVFAVLVGLLPALSAQQVRTDYDKSKNFQQYHSYDWARVQTLNPLWDKRVQQAIEAQPDQKGWSKETGGGDAAIVALGMTKDKQNFQTFYSGDPWMWRGMGGMASTSVEDYREGTLVFDIHDNNSRELLWRGVSTDVLSDKPENNEKKLDKGVEKLFAKCPPQSR